MDAISCLAPPPALLATNFTDAAIARALHFSMSSGSSASSSSSLSAPAHHQHNNHSPLLAADLPAYAPRSLTCDSVLVADSPRRSPPGRRRQQHQQQLAPAAGRAGKRRSRASKRASTTYISTDPANFRIMVQQITGVQAEPGEIIEVLQPALDAAAAVLLAADSSSAAAAAAAGAAYGNNALLAVPGGEDLSALHHQHQLQQQPCFPTLDSWNVMYERSEQLL
ncbi:hypothetical protein BAE44_0012321 [Dichanthelium oligosanthes]|uniref:VQ domain-containing protein n=1 Tax=Dichanthelium oligosanthes TaxID=888268 RepID=A0A1E5VNF4_9POAL|nr:hypothetical protein BAE44_0012321 [Dichanthelium oligosanthes]